jgi:hypothetical protein
MSTPPPVLSSKVFIGPNEEPPALPWYQFYENRVVGRVVGLGLIASSAATFAFLSKPWAWFSPPVTRKNDTSKSPLGLIPVGVSIVALIVGIRLRVKKYYKDPEALREYIQLFHNSSFSEAFSKLDSWDGVSRGAYT